MKFQDSITSKGKTTYLTAKLKRYSEQKDNPEYGQTCSVCGYFFSFEKDRCIGYTGMCKGCYEEQQELEESQRNDDEVRAEMEMMDREDSIQIGEEGKGGISKKI